MVNFKPEFAVTPVANNRLLIDLVNSKFASLLWLYAFIRS